MSNNVLQCRETRYITPFIYLNEKKINEINEYLRGHTLKEFIEYAKDFQKSKCMVAPHNQIDFNIISTYKQINYSKQQLKQMLQILQKKYFFKLHQLLQVVEQDFPLYSQFIQMMFRYMLYRLTNLSDCIAVLASKDKFKLHYDYKQFKIKIEKMITYCKNEQLINKVKNKIINKINTFIKNNSDIEIQPWHIIYQQDNHFITRMYNPQWENRLPSNQEYYKFEKQFYNDVY